MPTGGVAYEAIEFWLVLGARGFAAGLHPVVAAADDLTAWFMRATAFNTHGKTISMARPEILPETQRSMDCHYMKTSPECYGRLAALKLRSGASYRVRDGDDRSMQCCAVSRAGAGPRAAQ
jgi:hypothetical protein